MSNGNSKFWIVVVLIALMLLCLMALACMVPSEVDNRTVSWSEYACQARVYRECKQFGVDASTCKKLAKANCAMVTEP